MASFDIIRYMSSLTGYIFDDAVLERIALERSVADVASFSEITEKDKDLLTADLLFVLYTPVCFHDSICVVYLTFTLVKFMTLN